MADAVQQVNKVIDTIVKENDYHDYEVDIKKIDSGGANYTSQLFVITLSVPNKKELNLFAKVATMTEEFRAMTIVSVFETELTFYTKILAKYRELEERHRIPEEMRIMTAKFYGGSNIYMEETLVLEDLTKDGYESFNRFKCFDWDYASQCVTSVAKLHAYSIAYRRDEPEEYEAMIKKLQMDVPFDQMRNFQEKIVASAIDVTEDKYKDRLRKYFDDHSTDDNFENYYKPKSRPVLVHGDFRPSNILHKKNENGKLQVILVDYQVLMQGSPVSDILNFLITGSDEVFRKNHLYQLFDHYYEEFSSTLKRLGIEPNEVYSKEEYDKNVKERLPFGLTIGAFTLPFITVDEDKAPKPEDGIDIDSFAMQASDLFKIRFNELVRTYVDMGVL